MPELVAIEIPTIAYLHVKLKTYYEMVEAFKGYIEKMPQHRDYYQSIITHVEVFIEETRRLIAAIEEEECNPCQPH